MTGNGVTRRQRPLKLIYDAVCTANRSSLEKSLAGCSRESHSEMIAAFERHMSDIACFCHDSYLGTGTLTTAFIRELHRRHYPAGYREVQCAPDGEEVVLMVPGEYRTSLVGGGRLDATLAEAVQTASDMQALVDDVNATLTGSGSDQHRRDRVVLFGREMVRLQPFTDANERVASILVDLLLIRAGMAPIYREDLAERNDRMSTAGYGSLMAASLD